VARVAIGVATVSRKSRPDPTASGKRKNMPRVDGNPARGAEAGRSVDRPSYPSHLVMAGLARLMAQTAGRAEVVVGVVDGPADLSHLDLAGQQISVLPSGHWAGRGAPGDECRIPASAECSHGTFVVGMLAARRASPAPGICPACTVVTRQIFAETPAGQAGPAATPDDLAAGVVDTIDAGARVINLSLGLAASSLARTGAIDDAFDFAFRRGAVVVTAAGNHGLVGPAPLMSHPWLLPVAACDLAGRLLPMSNAGITIGRHGLLAPGAGLIGLSPQNGYKRLSGTSVAVPLVAGAAALLWSLAPDATAAQVRDALLLPGISRRSIIPPLLDAAASWHSLRAVSAVNPARGR